MWAFRLMSHKNKSLIFGHEKPVARVPKLSNKGVYVGPQDDPPTNLKPEPGTAAQWSEVGQV